MPAKKKSEEPSNLARALVHLLHARDRLREARRTEWAAEVDALVSKVGYQVLQPGENGIDSEEGVS
jgi:hypothetical protein